MPHTVRSRSLIVFLALALLALPALGQQPGGRAPAHGSPLSSLWQTVVEFVSGLVRPPDQGGVSTNAQGDLGPELDPLGR
jgi:hypothetical protein